MIVEGQGRKSWDPHCAAQRPVGMRRRVGTARQPECATSDRLAAPSSSLRPEPSLNFVWTVLNVGGHTPLSNLDTLDESQIRATQSCKTLLRRVQLRICLFAGSWRFCRVTLFHKPNLGTYGSQRTDIIPALRLPCCQGLSASPWTMEAFQCSERGKRKEKKEKKTVHHRASIPGVWPAMQCKLSPK